MTPMIVVISSPSGGGKTSITRQLLSQRKDCGYSVSATTRLARTGEENGSAYHFLSAADFDGRVSSGEFAEHAMYNGNRYGTLTSELMRVMHGGQHVLLDIEVQGARQVRARFPDAVLIFIVPPSGVVLAERLRGRGTETADVVAGRLQKAVDELGAALEYDYVVVNDDFNRAVATIDAILTAETLRTGRQRDIAVVLERLRSEVASELLRAASAH